MKIPATIRAGDSVTWRDDAATDNLGRSIGSADWSLTYYLRTNAGGEGVTVTGSAYGAGWESTIAAATTGAMDARAWFWQAVAGKGSEVVTLGAGQLTVLPAMAYTGTATAFDGRSQARKDLEACQAAIRALIAGGAVKKYAIGSRNLEKFTLAELMQLESKLKADVVREERAEKIANGMGDPRNLYVRFS